MDNWYIFHVQTGKEQTACDFLNKLFDKEESSAFIPHVELVFKNSKIIRKDLKPMFPGYVFTNSLLDERAFAIQTHRFIRFSKCIFRLLGGQDYNYIKLNEDDKNFLLGFCDDRYVVEESKGFIVEDKVIISSGPLKGKESVIKCINRHKRRAEIEFDYLGEIRRINVSLEIVSKV